MDLEVSITTVAIVSAMVQLLKTTIPEMPTRFLPLATTIIGIVVVLVNAGDITRDVIMLGLLTGLSASGLYEATVRTIGKKT